MKYRELPPEVRSIDEGSQEDTWDGIKVSNSCTCISTAREKPKARRISTGLYISPSGKDAEDSNIIDDRFMLVTFLKGLKPSIRAKVLLMNPQNVHEAQQCAETVEQSLQIDDLDDKVKLALSTISDWVQDENRCTRAVINALRPSRNVSFE